MPAVMLTPALRVAFKRAKRAMHWPPSESCMRCHRRTSKPAIQNRRLCRHCVVELDRISQRLR